MPVRRLLFVQCLSGGIVVDISVGLLFLGLSILGCELSGQLRPTVFHRRLGL